MPVTYSVIDGGHVVLAVVSAPLSEEEFIEFEINHAIDERLKAPVVELLRIETGALDDISMSAMQRVQELRREVDRRPTPHKCAIVVPYSDGHAWDLAKYYEGMAGLHSPESVIVFGDEKLARVWLAVDDVSAI